MLIILIVLCSILIFLVTVVLFVLLLKKSNSVSQGVEKTDILSLQNELNEKNNDTKAELIKELNELKTKQTEQKAELEKNISDNIVTTKDFISNHLITINSKTDNIADVKSKVDSINNLLGQNNKVGKAGEYLLERMFENISDVSGSNRFIFSKQYKLKKKTEENKELIVDLFIKGNGSNFVNIPVDAKFTFNKYLEMCDYQVKGDKNGFAQAKKGFEQDVKNRIDECTKYISDEDRTVYTIMFVPSEKVFNLISSIRNLIDYGFKKKVIIAGPSTLMTIISSVDNYMKLFDNISQYAKKIEVLEKVMKYMNNYDDSMKKLFNAIKNLTLAYNDVEKKEKSLNQAYNNLIAESTTDLNLDPDEK